jgi:hypothetical protein
MPDTRPECRALDRTSRRVEWRARFARPPAARLVLVTYRNPLQDQDRIHHAPCSWLGLGRARAFRTAS